jgi:hypothetical protein
MSRLSGPIVQSGFVVDDWESAARHWSGVLGVGPFFVVRKIEFAECFYRGAPVELDLTVAIAYSGDHQIEISQQHNDAPSIYSDFLKHNAPGLQHVGVIVDDVDRALDEAGLRSKVVQHGTTTAGHRFAYADTGHHNGTMVEFVTADEKTRDIFRYMKDAAANWDGTRPIRG